MMGRKFEGNSVLERGDTGTILGDRRKHGAIQGSRLRAFFLAEVKEVRRGQIMSGSWLGKDLFWPEGPSQCC